MTNKMDEKSSFTFSTPDVMSSPEKSINFGVYLSSKNKFVFAEPTAVHKQYKPKITRDAFKPLVTNVFALKESKEFQQLKRNSRSRVVQDNPEYSITCSEVPKALLTGATAREHFSQFGTIVKLILRPKKQTVSVYYNNKKSATHAYYECGDTTSGRMKVEWTKSIGNVKSQTRKKESSKNNVKKFLQSTDEEIRAELAAMTNVEYNLPSDNRPNNQIKSKSFENCETVPANASMEELQNLVIKPALTSEDKYKVLESRDRLIRMKQTKSHNLSTAKMTSGTCPDMCPEKERYMRESQRQLAPYELLERNTLEYKINHTRAVKQYSRSSADQEEPMPHELRPVKSLKMSMSYLLHEIIDLCDNKDVNLADWYHFLWDRTRSIRKDITQQELCCSSSVELVEQCARFHIVCAGRLCAEESSVFDKKINTENLTKCLQSLKYMYHDLREKGINCDNESEFQSYIILLNLNNGNFMWDLQRLPREIHNSKEIRYALDIYSAIESNNYCKFFKLVNKTSYLNGCLLLRYFNQVRVKALSIMVKAYCRITSTAFPLYEFIDILGFEDENEAIYFTELVGLNISNDSLHVMLNKDHFTLPASDIVQGRAYNMIDSKRKKNNLSYGKSIAGGNMPDKIYLDHKPHNSFDTEGYLMLESLTARDQKIDQDPYELVEEIVPVPQIKPVVVVKVPVVEKKIIEPKIPLIEDKKELLEEFKEKQSLEIFDDIYTTVIDNLCSTLVQNEINEINEINCLNELSESINREIIDITVVEFADIILKEEINIRKKSDEIFQRVKTRFIKKYFNVWKTRAFKKKRQRDALEDTPVWLQKYSFQARAKSLYRTEQNLAIEFMNKKFDFIEPEDAIPYWKTLAPIELIINTGLKENIKLLDTTNVSSNVFWKLIISWPGMNDSNLLWRKKEIIKRYLSNEVKYLQNDSSELHICIKNIDGFVTREHSVGMDALFFIIGPTEDSKCINKRLLDSIVSRDKLMPVPVVVAILNDDSQKYNGIKNTLEKLLESGYVSEYTFIEENGRLNEQFLLNLIQSSILWLAVNKSPPVPLEMNYLFDILDTCLMEELWFRIHSHSACNDKLSNALGDANFLINLHNEAVGHIMDIVLDPESLMYTGFPPELKEFLNTSHPMPCGFEYFDRRWKNEDYRAQLEDVMNSLVLPSWSSEWPITDVDVLHQCTSRYYRQVFSNGSNSQLFSGQILTNFFLSSGSYNVSSFIDILLCVVKEKIHLVGKELKVVYNKNHVRHFRTLPWWFKSSALMEQVHGVETNEEPVKKKTKIFDEDVYYCVEQPMEPLDQFCRQTQNSIMEIDMKSNEFENRLNLQKIQSELFEEKLMDALN